MLMGFLVFSALHYHQRVSDAFSAWNPLVKPPSLPHLVPGYACVACSQEMMVPGGLERLAASLCSCVLPWLFQGLSVVTGDQRVIQQRTSPARNRLQSLPARPLRCGAGILHLA